MSLANLLAIQRLQAFTASASGVRRLLLAAKRNLTDAQLQQLSSENRFDAAYKAIMQCAMLGLWAQGYRTSTNQPGHHLTAIQALPLTLAVPQATVIVLDALRKQRHLNDYEGDPITDAAVAECVQQAGQLLRHTEKCLQANRPDLLTAA
jgi:hypothetical protein